MGMVITTIAFLLLTIWLVRAHLRRTAGRRASATGSPAHACPRCGAALAGEAAICPRCGVPQQAYEIVVAATVPGDAGSSAPAAKPHAIVRADLCIGCGSCQAVCPVPGAIVVRGGLAAVDLALCEGHARCAEVCPTGAVFVGAGDAAQEVVAPELDAHFQTNVPGLYIVGELGGRGLIKNAINEGRIAAEHIAQVATATPPGNGDAGVLDLAIVGSGPAGISAGLESKSAGARFVILEQGQLADTIRKYPRHKLLLAEPVKIPLYGDLWVADSSKEALLSVWQRIVGRTGLDVRAHHRVTDVVRDDGAFGVRTEHGDFRARNVILALGRRGTPRRLGVPGEELSKVIYDVAEMEGFAGRRVLVVGGGDSAIESALGLARQPGATAVLSYRGESFHRVKERNRVQLEDAVRAGRIRVWLKSHVREITADAVEVEVDGRTVTLDNDDVIIRIGGEPPWPMLARAGVKMLKKSVPVPKPGPTRA